MTYFSLMIAELVVSAGKSLYILPSNLIYSDTKGDMFQGYIWIAITPKADNIVSMHHNFMGVVKNHTESSLGTNCRRK